MDKKRIIMAVMPALIFVIAVISIFYYNTINITSDFTISSIWLIFLSFLLTYYLFVLEKSNLTTTMLILTVLGIIWIIILPVFSPIDEGAHFAYIHHICKNGEIPLIYNLMDTEALSAIKENAQSVAVGFMYEAVHPPVYYVIMSWLCKWTSDVTNQFYFCRFMGMLSLFCVLFIIFKWINYLLEYKIITVQKKQTMIFSTMCILCSPGVLTRFGTVSNESLNVLITTICLFLFTKCIIEGVIWKRFIMINLLIVLGLMTKITSAFVVVLWLLVLFYYKEIKKLLCSTIVILISISPWLINNLKNYGALTGIKIHLDCILPIVNPEMKNIDILSEIIELFVYFFFPQEGNKSIIANALIYFIAVTFLLCFILFGVKCFKTIKIYLMEKHCKFNYTEREKKEIIVLLYFLALLGNIMVLILGSITSKASVIIARYLYVSFIPIIYIMTYWIERNLKCKNVIKGFIGVVVCFIGLEVGVGNISPQMERYIGNNLKEIQISLDDAELYNVKEEDGVFHTTGEDPKVMLKNEAFDGCEGIDLYMQSEQSGNVVLYYPVNGDYSETYKIMAVYLPGMEYVRFNVDGKIDTNNIRLDMLDNSSFEIENIKIYVH